MRLRTAVATTLSLALVVFLAGCPRPVPRISLSAYSQEISTDSPEWTFLVWNSGEEDSTLDYRINTDQRWLVCTPTYGASTDAEDLGSIEVSIDLTSIPEDEYEGTITVSDAGGRAASQEIDITVIKDVFAVSPSSYDFELSDSPWFFQIWNAHPELLSEPSFTITTDADWLTCTPTTGTSTGSDDKRTITVTADRSQLAEGDHEATITISGDRIVSKTVEVSITSEGGNTSSGGYKISDVTTTYAPPYLLEFAFSIRDSQGEALIAEPAQFDVACMEDEVAISSETDAHLAKGATKQLLSFLVLDYTLSMADWRIHGDLDANGRSDAIDNMEDAAKGIFLDALNSDAQAGVYEFHRADQAPQLVAGFTADKDYLKQRIDAIWTEFVQSFPAESRCWDAAYEAAAMFDAEGAEDERRAIVFLSDGYDESSTYNYQDVIDIARDRQIAIYCIGFGSDVNHTLLQLIAQQTAGAYYPADQAADLAEAFQKIVNNLGGQYVLRWATLKQNDEPFSPSFSLTVAENTMTYTADDSYVPTDHAGDRLQGSLRFVPSIGESSTSLTLRALYVPRYITRLRLILDSQFDFEPALSGPGDYGLCADWTLTDETDLETGQRILTLESEDPDDIWTGIPFASFGPILTLAFEGAVEDVATLLDSAATDNTIYDSGQAFDIEWPPTQAR